MPKLKSNGIEIEYEQFGIAGDKPLLMVMGLGAQMIQWDEEFLGGFVARGFHVTRFDNRDVGLSTKLEAAGTPNIPQMMAEAANGKTPSVAYTLDDMADDAAGVLDALGIESAHVAGASMGGMIAQVLAMRHPSRVRSLTSIMSSTGNPNLPSAKPEAMALLMRPRATDRDAAIDGMVEARKQLSGGVVAFDEERARRSAALAFDRSNYPAGMARQMAAIMAGGNRVPELQKLKVPTLVIHGDLDPLVPIEGGHDTANAIPGAEMRVVANMGHDLNPAHWAEITDAIVLHAEKAH